MVTEIAPFDVRSAVPQYELLLAFHVPNLALILYVECKKLQFIHTVNGDGSKTAKIIKRQC